MARLEELAERSAARQGELLLTVEDLKVHFSTRRGIRKQDEKPIRVVDGVSFSLVAGKTFSLVGESGCGKSTVAVSAGRTSPSDRRERGLQRYRLGDGQPRELRMIRRDIQIVFQDPYASLDPRMRVRDLLMEPLRVQGIRCPPRLRGGVTGAGRARCAPRRSFRRLRGGDAAFHLG